MARSSGIVGERWVRVIPRQVFNGARRFEDSCAGIGLARDVLTNRLNWPVDHGIHKGRDLCPALTRASANGATSTRHPTGLRCS